MSASMFKVRCLGHQLRLLTRCPWSRHGHRSNSGGYYILAPDMPSDTEETNPVLVLPKGDDLPRFEQFNQRQCLRAFVKRVLEFEAIVDEIDLRAEETDGKQEVTFDELYGEIERHFVPLNYQATVNRHLQTSCASRFSFPKSLEPSAHRSRKKRFTSRSIYEYMLGYRNNSNNNLNRFQRQVVDKYLLEGKLNGLSLDSDQLQTLQVVRNQLATHRTTFRSNVDKTGGASQQAMMDAKMLGALPDTGQVRAGGDVNANYATFMATCTARDLREEVFGLQNSRAFKADKRTNNSVVIEEIRSLRKREANLLGFDCYSDMSMQTKMAGSLDVVKSMINTLNEQNRDQLDQDLNALADFANERGDRIRNIELWDVDYYKGHYLTEKHKHVNQDDIRSYFPLEKVLAGLFGLANRVFQIHIEEVPRDRFQSWHGDVRLFRVVSPNGSVGSFYFDPWARSDDKISNSQNYSRMEILLNRSAICETQSIAAWILDLPRPLLQNQQINLAFQDVLRLAKGFGFVLQSAIGEVPYSEINGFNNLEWDVVNVSPEFMALWLLHDYKTVADCSAHISDGHPLPKDLHSEIRKAHYEFNSIELSRELYKSALDLSLYSNTEHWDDVVSELWKTYSTPFKLHHKDFHLCSFNEIMSDDLAASYYSSLWSKMLAADLFSQFDASNVESQGVKFRDTFLSLAGGVPMKELFRSFSKRDPSPEFLLKIRN